MLSTTTSPSTKTPEFRSTPQLEPFSSTEKRMTKRIDPTTRATRIGILEHSTESTTIPSTQLPTKAPTKIPTTKVTPTEESSKATKMISTLQTTQKIIVSTDKTTVKNIQDSKCPKGNCKEIKQKMEEIKEIKTTMSIQNAVDPVSFKIDNYFR